MSSGSCGLVTRVWVEAPSLARDETVTMMLCVSLGSKSVFFFGEWGGKAEENTYQYHVPTIFPLSPSNPPTTERRARRKLRGTTDDAHIIQRPCWPTANALGRGNHAVTMRYYGRVTANVVRLLRLRIHGGETDLPSAVYGVFAPDSWLGIRGILARFDRRCYHRCITNGRTIRIVQYVSNHGRIELGRGDCKSFQCISFRFDARFRTRRCPRKKWGSAGD